MKHFLLTHGRMLALVVAIIVIAQLVSIPLSAWLKKEGLPR